jgi:hypothetical protein
VSVDPLTELETLTEEIDGDPVQGVTFWIKGLKIVNRGDVPVPDIQILKRYPLVAFENPHVHDVLGFSKRVGSEIFVAEKSDEGDRYGDKDNWLCNLIKADSAGLHCGDFHVTREKSQRDKGREQYREGKGLKGDHWDFEQVIRKDEFKGRFVFQEFVHRLKEVDYQIYDIERTDGKEEHNDEFPRDVPGENRSPKITSEHEAFFSLLSVVVK